jgi:hypothetical protein
LVEHDSDHEMDPPTTASSNEGGEITVKVTPPTPDEMVVDNAVEKNVEEPAVPAPTSASGLAVPVSSNSSAVKATVVENTTAST